MSTLQRRSGVLTLTLALLLGAAGGAAPVRADLPLAGLVLSTADEPVAGALVTVTRRDQQRATTVYTDPAGRFTFPVALEAGRYALRVRAHGFRELARDTVDPHPGRALRLTLAREPDPRAVAAELPANRWLALLLRRISTDQRREEFVRQCASCHQQGNPATRLPRTDATWDKLLKLMVRMGAVVSPELRKELPGAFTAAYGDAAIADAIARGELGPPPALSLAATRAVVTEWVVGQPAALLHDLTVHPDDGRVYAVDAAQDQLYRLDPATGERKAWSVPRGHAALGGVLAGTALVLAPNSNAHVAPESLVVSPDGALWMTLALGNALARFDPASEQWTRYDQPAGLFPHTLRFDQRGRVWYTLALSDQVAMLDPATGARRTIRLPARTWGQALAARLMPPDLWAAHRKPFAPPPARATAGPPLPDGIDVAPDGSVWFSQPNARRIGRIDPETGGVRMIDTPFAGPRRLRFDSKGRLWILGFSSGLVARFDPTIDRFETWRLPTDPPGSETPYALNVDRRSDTVWIGGANSDSLIRFEPDYARFTTFPLPTRGSYTRAIDFDARGALWTASANFPAWQMEGPGPQLIRLEPEGVLGPNEGRLAQMPGE